MFKKNLLLGALLTVSAALSAQDFKADFDAFRKGMMKEYSEFRSKINEDYARFLSEVWEESKASPFIPKPKDDMVPPVVYDDKKDKREPKPEPIPFDEVVPAPVVEPQPEPVEPVKRDPVVTPTVTFQPFNLFGTSMQVRSPRSGKIRLSSVGEEEVSKAWLQLTNKDNDAMLADCLDLRSKRQLCDWAYLLMLQKVAEAVYGADTNEATLLMAWLYCQSGYKMRLARSADNSRLYMLYGSKHYIYDVGYYKMDGESFYPFGKDVPQRLYIANCDYPKETSLSLTVQKQPVLSVTPSEKRTRKSSRYGDMSVALEGNKNLMDFYTTYPTSMIGDNIMTRWAFYAETPMSEDVKRQLYPALRKAIEGKSQAEAVNRLLNWVQTGFEYEYDDKVWGDDRAFFAEESLYYPYCDCEDRSILFTRLVRDLVGLKCLLVYYPGHLASAVCFTEGVEGDYIMLDGKRYVVCDATYIGAPVGRTMPDMDNKTSKVILLK